MKSNSANPETGEIAARQISNGNCSCQELTVCQSSDEYVGGGVPAVAPLAQRPFRSRREEKNRSGSVTCRRKREPTRLPETDSFPFFSRLPGKNQGSSMTLLPSSPEQPFWQTYTGPLREAGTLAGPGERKPTSLPHSGILVDRQVLTYTRLIIALEIVSYTRPPKPMISAFKTVLNGTKCQCSVGKQHVPLLLHRFSAAQLDAVFRLI
jgi:hypothetical protein